LADDGLLWLAGENKAGIKSADKLLKKHFGQVTKLDNARHCTLYEAGKPLKQASFDLASYQQKWVLEYGNTELNISSYPGVFAHGRLDAGTALLLEALSGLSLEGDVLDFACGAGILGAFIAMNHAHSKVTLLDTSALALKASTDTLVANQLDGKVLASDGLSEVKKSYDYVISNPPIHTGVKTDNLLGQKLLASIQQHINPGGMLIMVANRHVPYEVWLSERFKRCRELTANAQYKVIAAIK
jgi:16S rRNA (guanine1207-N2)-methyltransferase